MRVLLALALSLTLAATVATQSRTTILFVGNSFTYGASSPVRFYRPETVTDLNSEGQGGMPALFKSFTAQAGIDYDVYLETRGGSGFEFHLDSKGEVLRSRAWDLVVMQGQSTLDLDKHGDPTKFLATGPRLAKLFVDRNPRVGIFLMSTWSRADLTYPATGAWFGKPIETMARDVRAAYDTLATTAPSVRAVIPVGEAWTRAMKTGVADANPYDGIEAGKLNLWTYDNYHASAHGYYLEALTVFGVLTGRDPRSLGENECSAFELGFSQADVRRLQQVAFDELTAAGRAMTSPASPAAGGTRQRCGQAQR